MGITDEARVLALVFSLAARFWKKHLNAIFGVSVSPFLKGRIQSSEDSTVIIISRLQDRIHVRSRRGTIGKMLSVFWVPPGGRRSRRVKTQEVSGDLGGVHTPPSSLSLSAHPLPLPSSADHVDGFQGLGLAVPTDALTAVWLPSSLPCRGLD